MHSSSGRKYDSGAFKRKKKQKLEEDDQIQRGALDKYVVIVPQTNSENHTPDGNIDDGHDDNAIEVEVTAEIHEEVEVAATEIDEGNDVNFLDEDHDPNISYDMNNSVQPDIFDPRNWDGLDPRKIHILLQKGPKREDIEYGPYDKFSRKFSSLSFSRILSNGEKWLVYNSSLDKAFCFCCKLLKRGHVSGQLANEGLIDWIHLGARLKEHESSREHITNMTAWYDFRLRMQKNQTIDKVSHKLYPESNGNFLGLIEMLAEFDTVIKEHVDRITIEKIRDHYLGPSIHNELINMLTTAIRSRIIEKVKEAKYFSVILDCTPDASHQEQMSLIIRYVDTSSASFCIEESFLGFLEVNDTTGQGLFNVLEEELNNLTLDEDNVRGQGYDNGSNMKGNNKGYRRNFWTNIQGHFIQLVVVIV
ncbi:hypothetical protein VPH35_059586 [Triticum aestivum]